MAAGGPAWPLELPGQEVLERLRALDEGVDPQISLLGVGVLLERIEVAVASA